MQNIVATIQKEQNDIIRDTTADLLIVQGVAGSGKTSAVLQRIAFLLYHSRSNLEADRWFFFHLTVYSAITFLTFSPA